MSQTVLLIEDDNFWQQAWERSLEPHSIAVLHAYTIVRAEKLFAANPDLAAIVVDACVQHSEPDSLPLVAKIKEVFARPIVAVSSSSKYRKRLMEVGCTHECEEKKDLPTKLLQILR